MAPVRCPRCTQAIPASGAPSYRCTACGQVFDPPPRVRRTPPSLIPKAVSITHFVAGGIAVGIGAPGLLSLLVFLALGATGLPLESWLHALVLVPLGILHLRFAVRDGEPNERTASHQLWLALAWIAATLGFLAYHWVDAGPRDRIWWHYALAFLVVSGAHVGLATVMAVKPLRARYIEQAVRTTRHRSLRTSRLPPPEPFLFWPSKLHFWVFVTTLGWAAAHAWRAYLGLRGVLHPQVCPPRMPNDWLGLECTFIMLRNFAARLVLVSSSIWLVVHVAVALMQTRPTPIKRAILQVTAATQVPMAFLGFFLLRWDLIFLPVVLLSPLPLVTAVLAFYPGYKDGYRDRPAAPIGQSAPGKA